MSPQIAFFPWLLLDQPVDFGSMKFISYRDARTRIAAELTNLGGSLEVILESYIDIRGKRIGNCVVALHTERNPTWDLTDEDHEMVRRNAQILSLGAIARNDYFTNFGCYSNSTTFQFFRQRFTEPVDHIAIGVRRRDGSVMDAGYKHGEIKFTVPLQSRTLRPTDIDASLVQGVLSALNSGSPMSKRIMAALPFFNLANTDNDVMDFSAEIILMGSAFEQLFETFGARELCIALGNVFGRYGKVTVNEAIAGSRPGILIDQRYEDAQRQWPLHRKWIEELYSLRNTYVHGLRLDEHTWGWSPLEHLVMSAFTFPLTVKLLLATEGQYTMTEADDVRLNSVDQLLAADSWWKVVGTHGNATNWQETLFEAKHDLATSKMMREITELFGGSKNNPPDC